MRIRFRKDVPDQDELREIAAEVLAAPVAGEHAVLEAVRKAGGDEDVEVVASMVVRSLDAIREAFGGKLPAELRKCMREDLGLPERKPQLRVVPTPAPVAKQTPEPSGPGDRETLEETIMKSKDALDHERLEKAAEQIRKADASLTPAQSYARALEQHPEFYEGSMRHDQLQKTEWRDGTASVTSPEETAVEKRLSKAADAIRARKGNEKLSRPQAIAKALEEDPTLYPA